MQDRNFDDIAEKFSRNIYGTTKGQLRQAILWQDLDRVLAEMGPQKQTGGRSKRCERQHAIYTLRRSGCCFAFGNAR